jgi:hypothetical protein
MLSLVKRLDKILEDQEFEENGPTSILDDIDEIASNKKRKRNLQIPLTIKCKIVHLFGKRFKAEKEELFSYDQLAHLIKENQR